MRCIEVLRINVCSIRVLNNSENSVSCSQVQPVRAGDIRTHFTEPENAAFMYS